MTPEQALQILTNATAILQANRADHNAIMQALATIESALEAKAQKEE